MNAKQARALKVAAFALAVVVLYPPWHVELDQGRTYGLGHALLFEPPEWPGRNYASGTVDCVLLAIELLVCAAISGISWLLAADRVRSTEREVEAHQGAEAIRAKTPPAATPVALEPTERSKASAHKGRPNQMPAPNASPAAKLPMGECPNCSRVIPMKSETCEFCQALFGEYSVWSVKPLAGVDSTTASAPFRAPATATICPSCRAMNVNGETRCARCGSELPE